jgi:hypothetical protein
MLAALFIYLHGRRLVLSRQRPGLGVAWANPYLQPASTAPDDSPIARLNAIPT